MAEHQVGSPSSSNVTLRVCNILGLWDIEMVPDMPAFLVKYLPSQQVMMDAT